MKTQAIIFSIVFQFDIQDGRHISSPEPKIISSELSLSSVVWRKLVIFSTSPLQILSQF